MLHFETEPKLDLKIVSLASSIHAECRGRCNAHGAGLGQERLART